MTTPSTERKAGPLLGTGAQTTWPFTFKVFAATDIAVTIANSLGVETALVYGVDYTVTLNANQETSPGGTVTYPISGTPLPAGSRLVIVGNLPYDQPLDLPSGGNFSPLAIENQLDRIVMQIQQLREQVGRAVQVRTTANADVVLPPPSANELIGWDPTGNNLQNFALGELATAVAYATMRYDTFTGDGVETQFTLTADPVTLANLDVAISGVTQVPGSDYSLLNGVLVFASAPPNGAEILARYGEGLVNVGGDSSDIRFLQAGTGAVDRTVQAKLREVVSVTDFGADPTGVADSTAAFQAAVDYFQSISDGYASPYVTIKIPGGTYKIAGANGVVIAYSFDVMQLCFEADAGAKLIGTGSNYCFKFNSVADPAGGGFRNVFNKLTFEDFGTAIRWHTNNRDQCSLRIVDCESQSNDVFLDTVSYANSRSSLIKIESCFFNDTRVAVNHYTDQMSIKDSWFYAKEGSYDAMLYLGGDGVVSIRDSFFIPNATPLTTPANARFIDYFCSGTAVDRSLKTLTVSNCRHSLEGARPFIWFWDYNPGISGNNQVCSITLEDSYFGGTGGNPVVTYKQGYPGSVNLRNCKVFASPYIVALDAGNTYPPGPSTPAALSYHVIMIDEATRLSQSNSNNAAALVDPALEPFCYDTTTQTSKYKRSFKKNIDYRLPAAAAGVGRVKVSVPVFFDSASAVSSRDIMSFIVVTVSDAGGPGFSNPSYRSQAVTLVSVIGGNSGSTVKRIAATALQNAQGGISFAYANNVSVFWGTGNTGSADIAANSTSGTEDNITIAWDSTTPEVSWAYIIPLAGMRENQQDKMQYGVW